MASAQGFVQFLLQMQKLPQLSANVALFAPEQIAHLRAGVATLPIQQRQLLDLSQRKPKLLGMLNEEKASNFLLGEQAEAACAARRLWQQSNSLIKTDGIDAEPGLFRGLADLDS